jgi:hypothetical protein
VLELIRQLDSSARIQVAQLLLETELDLRLETLIRRLAEREPADDITDTMIDDEVKAVRQSRPIA